MDAVKVVPTVEDILAMDESVRAELINGKIYYQAAPSRLHQEVVSQVSRQIGNYIEAKGGECKVYVSPFAVFLKNDEDYVEPDISVICDKTKLQEDGCHGAPDWIIEVLSPSSKGYDSFDKMHLYKEAGVREYWIVDVDSRRITVHNFQNGDCMPYINFGKIKVRIYEDLEIDFSKVEI